MSSWVFVMAQFAAAAAALHSATLFPHESQYVFYPLTPPPLQPPGSSSLDPTILRKAPETSHG